MRESERERERERERESERKRERESERKRERARERARARGGALPRGGTQVFTPLKLRGRLRAAVTKLTALKLTG